MPLSLDDALTIIAGAVPPMRETETCTLSAALGRVSAKNITAPYALPPFTSTGVDGYAFRHAGNRKTFKIAGSSFAGEPFGGTIAEGEAARIATGAVLPAGADTVAMQETCMLENGMLTITELPIKGANLRLAGGDIAQGEIAIGNNQILRTQDIALLNALNIQTLEVLRPLRIAIASTGLELLQPGMERRAGQIVDTNSLMLTQMLERPGVQVTTLPPLPDDYNATRDALTRAAPQYDIVITTGGVSVGDRDYVRDVLHDEGHVHFWKLAIRPGKPVIAGRMGACVMIGLPGNPVSAFVTAHLIVRAALYALWGRDTALPDGFPIPLAEDISKPEILRAFPRALFTNGWARPCPDQGSNLYTSLTRADGILDLPAGRGTFTRAEPVIYRPFGLLL